MCYRFGISDRSGIEGSTNPAMNISTPNTNGAGVDEGGTEWHRTARDLNGSRHHGAGAAVATDGSRPDAVAGAAPTRSRTQSSVNEADEESKKLSLSDCHGTE